MLDRLKETARRAGKAEWREMLAYVADLHEASVRQDSYFPYPWEEIGPGYCYGPGFGHWDIVHAVMDVMESEPEHAHRQLMNNLAHQQEDGLIPGCIYLRDGEFTHSTVFSHPPVWVIAAERYYRMTRDAEFLRACYAALERQIGWFRANRRADDGGYYYLDILTRQWESGVDEGIRFDDAPKVRVSCVDATAHMYLICETACRWVDELGVSPAPFLQERDHLRAFLQNELYDPKTGWFYDVWKRHDPKRFPESFEGIWPVIVGAATPEQAKACFEHLLDPSEFCAEHPVSTVSLRSKSYQARMWRGPAWNSMTYWCVLGLLRYGFRREARALLEKTLDASAKTFAETGNIWEFYDPKGGDPARVQRKPDRTDAPNHPCTAYLGHNPLIEMARLWDELA